MLGGDKSLYDILIKSFLYDVPFDEKQLDLLITAGKNEEAGTFVHRCKGAAGQIGAEQLHEAGQALEDVLKGRTQGDIPVLQAKFLGIYNETVKALIKYRMQS